MGVGPPGRTGRDQVAAIRALAASLRGRPAAIVAVACENAAPGQFAALEREGVVLHRVSCTGNLHSSVVELALAAGAPGVIVYSCPPRDCRGREGPRWLDQRLFHDREAELNARVDRRRVATATMAVGNQDGTLASLRAFRAQVDALEAPGGAEEPNTTCLRSPVTVGEGVA
jgi:coenzyme F420-reducing hydrogenase delta subunit